jgi:MFS family permease
MLHKKEHPEHMHGFDDRPLVKKSLKHSIKDGAFFSIMDAIMVNFLAAYALFLGAPNIIISLLSSLPDLFGSLFQLLAIQVKNKVRHIKPVMAIAAFLQATTILLFLTIPQIETPYRNLFILIFAIIFTMIGSFINPIWRSIMGDLVPEDERGAYFSKRTMIIGIIGFITTLGAGLLLNYYKQLDHALTGFIILFIVAFIARAVSSFWLSRMYEKEPTEERKKVHEQSFIHFVKKLPQDDFGKFVLFVSLFSLTVAVASPFFVVYKLKELGLSYAQFTILSLAELIASLGFLRIWGYFNDKKGSKLVLTITGFLIPFVPFLWLFGKNFYYLLILQVFSGIVWGGFNLAVGNFLFDATEKKTRTKHIAYFNLFNGIAVFFGALLGGLLLLSLSSVKTIFLISSILRFAIAAVFLLQLKEMRLIELPVGKSFIHYSIYIKPKRISFQNDDAYSVDRLKKEDAQPLHQKKNHEKQQQKQAVTKQTTNPAKKKSEKKFVDYMFKKIQEKK